MKMKSEESVKKCKFANKMWPCAYNIKAAF